MFPQTYKCIYLTITHTYIYTYNTYSFLSKNFPNDPPILKVFPQFDHPMITKNGDIIDEKLKNWNPVTSNLKKCIAEILSKLENRMPIMSNPMLNNPPMNLYNDQMKNKPQPQNNQVAFTLTEEEEKSLIKDVKSDLEKKSIEELIYINFNPEHYVVQFTQNGRTANERLLEEVKQLSTVYDNKKREYDKIKGNIEQCKMQYEQKENELKDLYTQKQQIDGQFSVDRLINDIARYIEENFQKPKQQIVADFMNKKITLEEFQQKFKELSTNYHYYSIIKDKLNLCK